MNAEEGESVLRYRIVLLDSSTTCNVKKARFLLEIFSKIKKKNKQMHRKNK